MEIYQSLGSQALIGIISHLFFIVISFIAIQAFRVDQLFKKGHVFQIQLVYILISIVIGTTVSNFILDISTWSKQIQYLFN